MQMTHTIITQHFMNVGATLHYLGRNADALRVYARAVSRFPAPQPREMFAAILKSSGARAFNAGRSVPSPVLAM